MKRYLYRTSDGKVTWCPHKHNVPKGAKVLRELPPRCVNPRCRVRGGVAVAGGGSAKCAECGVTL